MNKRNHIHGLTRTPTYYSWSSMIRRCYEKKHKSFPNYGGRGISVCRRWRERRQGLLNFIEDMGMRPEGTTLDRIDFNGDYTPENCRWSDSVTQANNRRPRRH